MAKETYTMAKETYRIAKETYDMVKETYTMAKETYTMAKETYCVYTHLLLSEVALLVLLLQDLGKPKMYVAYQK